MSCNQRTSWLCVCFLLLPFASTVAYPQPLPRVVASGLHGTSKLLAVSRGILVAERAAKVHTPAGCHSSTATAADRRSSMGFRPAWRRPTTNLPVSTASPSKTARCSWRSVRAIQSSSARVREARFRTQTGRHRFSARCLHWNSNGRWKSSIRRVSARAGRPRDIGEGASGYAENPSGETATLQPGRRHSRLPPCAAPRRPEQRPGIEPVRPRDCRLVRPLAGRCFAQSDLREVNWCERTYTAAVSFPRTPIRFRSGRR